MRSEPVFSAVEGEVDGDFDGAGGGDAGDGAGAEVPGFHGAEGGLVEDAVA
jgi:hypothetical protein